MSAPLVGVENLSFRYLANSRPVIDGLSFLLGKGEMFGVVGQSGSGKTTLLKLLSGELNPSGGTINLAPEIDWKAAGRMGIVHQTDTLFPWRTVRQNLQIAKTNGSLDEREAAARACLARVGLEREIMDYYPMRLSIGMRKRVEVARALLAQTHLVLADEPFAALDPSSTALTRNWILERLQAFDAALIVASHDLREILTYVHRLAVFVRERGVVRIVENQVAGLPVGDKRVEDFRYEVAKMIGAI